MEAISVLVFYCTSLLALGVESMLTGHDHIHTAVVHGLPEDGDRLNDLLDQHRPDVVLLVGCQKNAPVAVLLPLLARAPAMRVIIVNLEHNWLQVYQKQDVLLTRSSDLLQVLNSSW
ncbi:MAG: hypothetical protein ACKOC5_11840 [Chloroflexota bacterium]